MFWRRMKYEWNSSPISSQLGKFVKMNFYAASLAWFRDGSRKYQNRDKRTKPENFDRIYQTAVYAFTEMGVDLKKHPLEVGLLSKGCYEGALLSQDWTGDYDLEVDPSWVKKYQREEGGDVNQYWRALFAHEAVHAVEHHSFFKCYFSFLAGLIALEMCTLFKLQSTLISITTISSMSLTNQYLGRFFEFRADRVAATRDPEIGETLKTIFRHEEKKSPAQRWYDGFFSDYPSAMERRKALENLSPPLSASRQRI